MSISSFAVALQGKDFKCVLDRGVKRDDKLIKMLADRAASMVTVACGMRSGKVLTDDKILFWIYTWDTSSDAEAPLFYMTDVESEYLRWIDRFAEGRPPSQQ